MKAYFTPNVELVLFETVDIITASDIANISWTDFTDPEKDLYI